MKGKYLITTDGWFVAPDGKDYQSVWGDVEILKDDFLGIKTNRMSTNWFIRIGNDKNHVIIAGCQVHYACKSDDKPNTESVERWSTHEGKTIHSKRQTSIYIAE